MTFCTISDATGGSVFKTIVETLSSQMSYLSLRILSDRIEISGVDSGHVSVATISLFSSCFSTFHKLEPDNPVHVYLSLEQLKKILRACGSDDTLSIIINKKDDICVTFQFENLLRCHAFSLTVLDIEEESLDIPELDYETVVQLPAQGFRRMFDEMSVMDSEAVHFTSTSENLSIVTTDVVCQSKVNLNNSSPDVDITWTDDVSIKVSLPKIRSYGILSKLCSHVTIHISENFPALFYFKFMREIPIEGENEKNEKNEKHENIIIGEGKCHIAPLVNE